jgi:hypothetical protein
VVQSEQQSLQSLAPCETVVQAYTQPLDDSRSFSFARQLTNFSL